MVEKKPRNIKKKTNIILWPRAVIILNKIHNIKTLFAKNNLKTPLFPHFEVYYVVSKLPRVQGACFVSRFNRVFRKKYYQKHVYASK